MIHEHLNRVQTPLPALSKRLGRVAGFALLFIISLQSVFSQQKTFKWERVARGVMMTAVKDKAIKAKYTVVCVDFENCGDLRVESYSSATSDSSAKLAKGGWQKSFSVAKVAKQKNALIAINTTPFKVKSRFSLASPAIPVGLVVSGGKVIHEGNNKYAAILFYDAGGYKAKIISSQDISSDEQGEYPREAAGGFWVTYEAGKVIPFKEIKDTRVAVGTDISGKLLYILAGKRLSYNQVSVILERLGCVSVLELDGGSSTSLVVGGKARVREGLQRKVPCALFLSK